MKIVFHILILITVSLSMTVPASCTGGYDRDLMEAERLLRHEMADSAMAILDRSEPEKMNSNDYACYILLLAQASFKQGHSYASDSLLYETARYFVKNGDKDRQCLATLYAGMIRFSNNDLEGAAIRLKQAEHLLEYITDKYMHNKVYAALTALNYAVANDSLGLMYARKELASAIAMRDNVQLSFAYNHLACLYSRLGNRDSLMHYISAVEPLIPYMPRYARVQNLSNVGFYYQMLGDSVKGEEYIRQSYKTEPIVANSNLLAKIYFNRGDTASAMNIWRNALAAADAAGEAELRGAMARILYEAGKYKESGDNSTRADFLNDSLQLERKARKANVLQLDYDHRMSMEKARRNSRVAVAVLICVILGAAAIIIVIIAGSRHADAVKEDYKNRIDDLETDSSRLKKDMSRLKKELVDIEESKTRKAARGKELFDCLNAGGNIQLWTKADFDSFFSYYDIVDPDFRKRASATYRSLSRGNRLLLILSEMSFDNDSVCRIMGISPGSLRSARSRLRSKMCNGDCGVTLKES